MVVRLSLLPLPFYLSPGLFFNSGHFTLPFIPFHLSLYFLQDMIRVFGGYKGKCELVLVRLDSSRFLFHMWADLIVRHLPISLRPDIELMNTRSADSVN